MNIPNPSMPQALPSPFIKTEHVSEPDSLIKVEHVSEPDSLIKAEHVSAPDSPERQLAPPADPQYHDESIDNRGLDLARQAEVMMFRRHRLQKVFLPKNPTPVPVSEMPRMVRYLESLERWENLKAEVIRNTKIHKVVKGISKHKDIPLDNEYRFRERCRVLFEKWMLILDADEMEKAENGLRTQPYRRPTIARATSRAVPFITRSSAATAATVSEHFPQTVPANGILGDWQQADMMMDVEETETVQLGIGYGGRWVSQAEDEERAAADARRKEAGQRLLKVSEELRMIAEMLAE